MAFFENFSKFWGCALIWNENKTKKFFLSLTWGKDNEKLIPARPDLVCAFQLHFHSQTSTTTTKWYLDPSTGKHHQSYLWRAQKILSSKWHSQQALEEIKMQAVEFFLCQDEVQFPLHSSASLPVWWHLHFLWEWGSKTVFWTQAWKYRSDCLDQSSLMLYHKENTVTDVERPLLY